MLVLDPFVGSGKEAAYRRFPCLFRVCLQSSLFIVTGFLCQLLLTVLETWMQLLVSFCQKEKFPFFHLAASTDPLLRQVPFDISSSITLLKKCISGLLLCCVVCSGGITLACAKFGGFCLGSDINHVLLRGKGETIPLFVNACWQACVCNSKFCV